MTDVSGRAPIRVGLIGAGQIAARHAAAYRSLGDRAQVVAVADIRTDQAAALAGPAGASVHADLLDLLSTADVDAVDICLPHHLHAHAILTAAKHGRHILAEKPLCLTLAEAEQILDAIATAGVVMMCMHNRLYSAVAVRGRELLAEGALGQLFEVRATDCFWSPAGPDEFGWRTRVETSGGGELIDTGYHSVYLLLALAGAEPVSVAAMISRHRLSFLEGEDSASLLVRFANEVVGSVTTSWAYQPPESFEHFAAVGELGSLACTRTRLTYQRRSRPPVVLEFDKGDDIAAAIGHFVDCLTTGAQPTSTASDGALALAVILAAYESARTSTIVAVPAPRPRHAESR